jgi:2'-5' RNA ligase
VRLFLAVPLSAAVIESAAELVEELRERARRLAPRARITWASPRRMHITLSFLGEVEPDRASRLQASLAAPFDMPPFTIELAGLGTFPRSGPPRVVWAGVDAGGDGLVDLAGRLSTRLVALGLPVETRDYHPHLTLARIREAAGLRAAALLEGRGHARLGTTQVEAITLFESRLSPEGPEYVPLQQMPLAAA